MILANFSKSIILLYQKYQYLSISTSCRMIVLMKKERAKELGRFVGVGSVSFIFDYILLNLFASWFKLPILVANSMSAVISTYLNYNLNRHIVFEDKMHGERKTLLIYVSIVAFSILVIQNAILYFTVDSIAIDVAHYVRPWADAVGLSSVSDKILGLNLAKAFATFIASIWNYLMVRKFAFVTKDDLNEGKATS